MPRDAHHDSPSQPQRDASADSNGVIADPPGRSPSEVDDSALRPLDGNSETPEPTEDTSGAAEG
jgi:hypothetical protein